MTGWTEVVLGGRRFRVIDFERRSVLQDHYLQKMVRSLGMDKILPGESEANEAYMVRLHTALVDSGRAHELIAGYLLPEGVDERAWTYATAAETAAHIGSCNTADDREAVLDLAMQAAFGFFRQGLERLASLRSSIAASSPTPEPSRPPLVPLH